MSEEVPVEVIQKTQKYLGKFVKKPALTEKLLKKPPFRFLHDIITTVIKETGFLKGLFNETELKSENMSTKDAKIEFLNKLIDAVKYVTKTELSVRSSKIVAGLEPKETNILLQTIGKAIDKKVDTSEYVKKIRAEKLEDKKKSKKNADKNINIERSSKTHVKERTKRNEPKKLAESENIKLTDRSKPKKTPKIEKAELQNNSELKIKKQRRSDHEPSSNDKKIDADEIISSKVEDPGTHAEETNTIFHEGDKTEESLNFKNNDLNNKIFDIKNNEENIKSETGKQNVSLVRPKSARPKSGDLQKDVPAHIEETASNHNRKGILQQAASNSLRPPSVRPSSARPGAPRLRPDSALPMQEMVTLGKINVIVENFDKDGDDDDTVVIQTSSEEPEVQSRSLEFTTVPPENKGQLVEQILEQINSEDASEQHAKVEQDWEKEGLLGKDNIKKEMNQLRTLIQMMTKTANPLGKLLNYLNEDVDAMHSELEMWTRTKKHLLIEIKKQRRLSEDTSKPLLKQQESLQQEIDKIEEEILAVRSNIFKNEIRIKELVMK